MKKLYKILLVIFLSTMGFAHSAQASHVAGVDITYQCVGQDSFLITVNVFRDCDGISWTAPSINVDFSSTCGQNFSVNLPTTNTLVNNQAQGIDVSQLCPTAVSNCANGTHPGMELYTYQAIVVLNPPCDTWTMSYAPPCCRNNSVNLASNNNAYIATTMNSATDSCNNSPTIATTNPNPYACVNQLICYDLGVTEIDGDSLVYSFDTAYNTAGNAYAYNAGFSPQSPIAGISIDPNTGNIQFTPTAAGNYVIVVKVCEYERGTGALLGCVRRDLQWVVNNCGNNAPAQLCQPNSIISFTGTGAQTGPNEVEVCYGQNFTFTILVSDVFPPGSNQFLTATSNVQSVLPGSQFTVVSNAAQDSLWVTISWVATIGANPFNTFNLEVSDNNCPVTATNSGTYVVKVIPSTYAGPDQQLCKGETANLSVVGGNTFTWNVISGDFNSLPCTTCKNLSVTPNTTTEYRVVSDLSSSCKNVDTVLVTTSQPFGINMSNDTTICFNDSTISISAVPDLPNLPNRGYSYQWGPQSFLTPDTTQTINATPLLTKDYYVEITSDSGCVQYDTMNVVVSPPFPSGISVTTNNSLACTGLSTQINLSLGNSPSSCGLSTGPCIGPEFTAISGTQTAVNQSNSPTAQTTAAWPAPYGNAFANVKQQFLIRSSELQSIGMNAGKITSLAFDIDQIVGTSTYFGFTIKMGCTTDSVLNFWKTGLSTVFNSKTINLTSTGWNQHAFDNIYDWDGQSNIVIELCFANAGLPSNNSQTRYSTTSFNSALYFASNNQAACFSNLVSAPPLTRRPNMQFSYCVAPDTNAYNYRWFPTAGLVDTFSLKPTATVSQSTTYYVQVADTFGACIDTAEITLNIANIDAGRDTAICPADSLQLNAQITASCPGGSGTLLWQPSVGLSNDSIPNPIVTIDSTTTYTVSFTDNCGCTVSDTITIFLGQVGSPQVIKKDPDCGVDNGEYSFSISGGFKPYNYTIDGGISYQQADSVFDNLPIGYYTLFVVDSLGCPSDTIVDTLANFGSPVIDSIKTTDVNCFGAADGIIEVFASGGLLPTFYSIDSGLTFQASNVFTSVDTGNYYVVVRSADTCATLPKMASLSQPNLLTMNFQAFNDTCYQLGDGYAIANGVGGVGGYEYLWSNNKPNDTIATGFFAGSYSLTILDTNNCSVDTNFVIEEPTRVGIDSIITTDITCFGYDNGKIEIFASGGDSIFRYSVDSGQTFYNNRSIDSLSPGTYEITVLDQSLCRIDGQATVIEPPLLEVSTNIDTAYLCHSNCTTLISTATGGNSSPYSFTWSPNLGTGPSHNVCPSDNITYAVYASDNKSCVSEVKTVTLLMYDSLDVIIPEDTFFCFGSSLQLNAIPTGGDGAGYDFEWTPYQGLNNPKIPNPIAFPDSTTTYTISVSDKCGSPEIQKEVEITVNPIPTIDFSIDTTEGCEPFYVKLSNNSTLQHACWVNYGTGSTINTCGDFFLEYVKEGTYDISVRVRSREGCENAKTIPEIVTVYPKPTANFLMSPQPTSVLFPEITFEDVSKGNIVDYTWNFASFGSSKEQNPVFEFPNEDSATYPVKLAVITNRECKDDTVQNVEIGQEYVMFVPSGFTPNGDGLNDLFFPEHTGVDDGEYTLVIFDRWGGEIFRTNDKNQGWDGTNQKTGEPALSGIYVWKLVVGDYSVENERHEYMGDITLMR